MKQGVRDARRQRGGDKNRGAIHKNSHARRKKREQEADIFAETLPKLFRECYACILCSLPVQDILCTVPLVCKGFRDMVFRDDGFLWEMIGRKQQISPILESWRASVLLNFYRNTRILEKPDDDGVRVTDWKAVVEVYDKDKDSKPNVAKISRKLFLEVREHMICGLFLQTTLREICESRKQFCEKIFRRYAKLQRFNIEGRFAI